MGTGVKAFPRIAAGTQAGCSVCPARVQCHMGCAHSEQKPSSSLRMGVDQGPFACQTLLGSGVDLWLGQAGPDNSLKRAPTLEGFAVPLRFYKGRRLNRKQSRAKEPWMNRREAFGWALVWGQDYRRGEGKLATVGEKTLKFVVFAYFRGVNTLTMASFNLRMQSHWDLP